MVIPTNSINEQKFYEFQKAASAAAYKARRGYGNKRSPAGNRGGSEEVMEAMSYGIPVIATNVGGVKELFRNCPLGYIIDADITSEDLKEQILEYILLPQSIHNQMKANCYVNWTEEWDAKTNYTNFAEELLGV